VRISLLVNTHRPDAIDAAREVARSLADRGVAAVTGVECGPLLDVPEVPLDDLARSDLVVTFGGDGMLIYAAHLCSATGAPILGVHYGRFGFVTQCAPEEAAPALRKFLEGRASYDRRMMVKTDIVRQGKVVATLHSLNEAVVQRAATTRMLTFDVTVDGQRLTRYPADGVMVATPTGSTAYNLSAGGPILDPSMQAMLLTAITPHTLSARPLVLRPEAEVVIAMETRGDAVLSCDGQSRLQLLSGDSVRIVRSERETCLVMVDEHDFLAKLRDRLLWSRGVVP
jgi:NAD+ kinase